jgi:hypothetical protein
MHSQTSIQLPSPATLAQATLAQATLPAGVPGDGSDAALAAARKRRIEIAKSLDNVRQRNRFALMGLGASVMCAFAGVALLWWVKSAESNDPIELKLRSPIEFQIPFTFESKKPSTSGSGLDGGPGGPQAPNRGNDSSSVVK